MIKTVRNYWRFVVVLLVVLGTGVALKKVLPTEAFWLPVKDQPLRTVVATLQDQVKTISNQMTSLTRQTASSSNSDNQAILDSLTAAESPSAALTQTTTGLTVTSNETQTTSQTTIEALLPDTAVGGNPLYFDGEVWKEASNLYFNSGKIGIGKTAGVELDVAGDAAVNGKLTVYNDEEDHLLELFPANNTGYLSSSGGALFIENTNNIGSGVGIYSNAGSEALGNMINIKVDNPDFAQAAFYMNYDGTSNAVEIRANTNDRSSNALSLTNFNQLDSGLGVIGYELDRGSVKISHVGTGSDSNASGLSIDLQGSGTAAQGIYVDSTATSGTTGKLLRLRNKTVDRFVVDSLGSVTIGTTGTDTTITKNGNTSGDQFFVGTTGAFRVQRSATNSEAFRVQVSGDTYGRWLGTSDGKLKWSSGSSDYDVILERTGTSTLQLTGGILDIKSPSTNSDVMAWLASDGSRLGRVVETSGGYGWFEIDDNAGTAKILFRADGGSSYLNSGNFGIGTTSFGTSANKVLALGNGTAPSTSITDGVQLFAVDFDSGDGSATSELRVRDEDGNTTTLSPHNFSLINNLQRQDLDWSYYSEKNNLAINVNMAEVIRQVENLTGNQLMYIQDLKTKQYLDRKITPLPKTLDTQKSFIDQQTQLSMAEIDQHITDALSAQRAEQNQKKADFYTIFDWSNDSLKKVQQLTVLAETQFSQAVQFLAPTWFKKTVHFDDTVTFTQSTSFDKPLLVGIDTAGEIKIPTGQTQMELLFSEKPTHTPIITASPRDFIDGSYKIQKTDQGFNLILEKSQNHDVWFDWMMVQSNATTQPQTTQPGQTSPTSLPDDNKIVKPDKTPSESSPAASLNAPPASSSAQGTAQ